MGIRYPKEFVKPDGRKLIGGGPRDLQRRQQMGQIVGPDASLIEDLKKQIQELKDISKNTPKPDGYFSPEEVDEEIRRAVESAVKETTISLKRSTQANNQEVEPALQKYKVQILELQRNNDEFTKLHKTITEENLELKKNIDQLKQSESVIVNLQKQIAVLEQTIAGKEELIMALKTRPVAAIEEIEDPNRPKMDNVFVDPLESGAGEKLKANIKFDRIKPPIEKEQVDDKVGKLKSLLGKLPTKKN